MTAPVKPRSPEPPSLPRARGVVIRAARRWADSGGAKWSDAEWERELKKLRKALANYDEALNR